MGTRGSASTEYFLENSYAVIFLYRKKTLQPFERRYNAVNLLDIIEYADESHKTYKISEKKDPPFTNEAFSKILDDYTKAKDKNLLLKIDYINLVEYLCLLEYTCKKLNDLGTSGLIYLAAAVSDFYLPKSEMPTHKIQSNQSQGLRLDLKPVPKMLGKLKSEWCPNAFVVSFKLETDASLLTSKCKQSLEKYKQNIVIGNLLEDRKNKVELMQDNGKCNEIILNERQMFVTEIEKLIVNYLIELHNSFKAVKN